MNILQIISLVEEVLSVYNTLSQDGTLARLKDAETAMQTELNTTKDLQKLLALTGIHLPALAPLPVAAPAPAPAVGAETAADSAA